MTLNEALHVLGTAILIVITKVPDSESLSYPLYHAIIEEWLGGTVVTTETGTIEKFSSEYGGNMLRQAARVIADTIKVYGDLKEQ